jgi:hypothetical protein
MAARRRRWRSSSRRCVTRQGAGRFVFFSKDASRRIVLAQAEASSGLLTLDAIVVY